MDYTVIDLDYIFNSTNTFRFFYVTGTLTNLYNYNILMDML